MSLIFAFSKIFSVASYSSKDNLHDSLWRIPAAVSADDSQAGVMGGVSQTQLVDK